MAKVFDAAWKGYQFLFEELPDPRVKEWLFVAKPYQLLAILGLYLMFVLKWGPKHMKNRQPYNLDKLLIAYNAFQIFACLYVFVMGIYVCWGWEYKWICEPVDYSNKPKPLKIAGIVHFYYLLKLIDLLDTVFFVLRKKFNQVTFLHIYHHAGMCALIWGATTYFPGGHGTLVGVINSFVHVVMYSYYLLTVAVPSIKNAIWLKKFVTQLQIVQFFWCVVHMSFLVFKTDCEYPRWISAVFLPQNLFMLVLFIDFYLKTYHKKPKEQLRAQINGIKTSNGCNGNKNNGVSNNGDLKTKIENGVKEFNDKEINDVKTYLKNDLSKLVNGNGVTYTNNSNVFDGNINYFENGKEKLPCGPGKCKINCHKHYKNE